jgi:glycine oxidase
VNERADVVVVGAGIVGLATAWRAARDGMRVVVIGDTSRAQASRAAVGGLSFCPADAVLEGHQAVVELSAIAKARFGEYVSALEAASGVPTRWRLQPTLMVSLGEADEALIDRVEAARAAVGLSSARLTGSECRATQPGLSEEVAGGLLLEDHHQIDSRAFTDSLRAACEHAGVEFVAGAVRGITSSAERATGVRLESGTDLEADDIVIAAGAWSSAMDGLPPEMQHVVRPISGQIVIVEIPERIPAPRHDLRSAGAYLVVRSDRTIVLGATKVERGFESAPMVRAVHALLSSGAALWPAVLDCEWRETVVGLRPRARDGLPIVGRTSLPGLHVATAHFRNGVMFGAVSADAVVEGIRGGTPLPLFEAFSPLREVVE